jgi:hypothetical protein
MFPGRTRDKAATSASPRLRQGRHKRIAAPRRTAPRQAHCTAPGRTEHSVTETLLHQVKKPD